MYEYELCKKHKKEFGFTHLLCSGIMGVYSDWTNKKYDATSNQYIMTSLNEKQVDRIVRYSTGMRVK